MKTQRPRAGGYRSTPVVILRDRRRPDRSVEVNPNLIELLRHPADMGIGEPPCFQPLSNDLDAATGIALAVLITLAMWSMCLGLVWLITG